jgi:hypothetical protein
MAAGFAGVLLLGQPLAAAEPDADLMNTCPFAKGDSITKVRAFYGTSAEPRKMGTAAYQFHFQQYGVWVFFDSDFLVASLRFDPPFGGKIDGVAIGATKDEVRAAKGEPTRQFQGMPDTEAAEARKQHNLDIVNALPDPAPKKQVLDAFAEIARLDAQPAAFMSAWIYGQQPFVRYDFATKNGTVRMIFTNSCAMDK